MSTIHEGQPSLPGMFRVAAGVNYQSLGDEEDGVILSLASGYLYRCNHTAVAILALLPTCPALDELVEEFASRFGLDPERARADVVPLVEQLVDERLVEKAA